MFPDFDAKLAAFTTLLEQQKNERMAKRFPILHTNAMLNGRRGYHHVGTEVGRRFVKVFEESGQRGVCYFVEKETGIIFGAKGWKAYNPIHEYGTLDTIDKWHWGEYYATSLEGKTSMVPKGQRR